MRRESFRRNRITLVRRKGGKKDRDFLSVKNRITRENPSPFVKSFILLNVYSKWSSMKVCFSVLNHYDKKRANSSREARTRVERERERERREGDEGEKAGV